MPTASTQHNHREMKMSEPVSHGAASVWLWKLLGLSGLVGAGVLGAVFMAAFDPPKTRKMQFAQAAVAGTSSLIFGPVFVKILDHYSDWINLATATAIESFEAAAPVYLITGALSWGAFGAMAKLRQIIHERAAEKVAQAADKVADKVIN